MTVERTSFRSYETWVVILIFATHQGCGQWQPSTSLSFFPHVRRHNGLWLLMFFPFLKKTLFLLTAHILFRVLTSVSTFHSKFLYDKAYPKLSCVPYAQLCAWHIAGRSENSVLLWDIPGPPSFCQNNYSSFSN